MKTDLIRIFYGYHTWANARILTACDGLNDAQFIAVGSASFSSIRDTLVHTMWAQWNWLLRWRGEPDPPRFDPAVYPDVSAVRHHWHAIDVETHAFVARVDEAALDGICRYVNSRNEPMAYPLWQQMLHQVNHGTQHRSEVAVILTEYGHSPGWMDFIVYLDLNISL
ncbi:MAG: DinB family protein [Thermomicrobiales bacterium]